MLSVVSVRSVFPYLLLALSLMLAASGCAGAAKTASQVSSPEGQRAIATSIAARAAGSVVSARPPGSIAGDGPQTVASILASAPASPWLDGGHLAKGVGCEACHGTLPADGKPAVPNTARCLSCHGGSYDALGAKSAALGPMNPHKAHTGKLDCSRCHGVHRPFEYSCNSCHDFPIPEKYRTT